MLRSSDDIDKITRKDLEERMYSLSKDPIIRERIRICLGCRFFSLTIGKCTECSCVVSKWVGKEKLLNKNYSCPKGFWK